jgi:hypothetical protein
MAESDEPKGEIPPPLALALVVCDAIWTDPWTGKRTIIGTFSTIQARHFPAKHPILSVYAAFTDGRGKVPIRLVLVDANEENEPLFSAEAEIEFDDPRVVVELALVSNNVTFPTPGEYRLQLYSGSHPLLERRILLNQLPEAPDEQPPSA